MSRFRLPFRYLKPVFCSGLFDDPLLYVKIRPSGRALLFDAGKMQHLAKRILKSLDAVFVSHAHMDHFMGVAALTRSMHVASRRVDLYGPAGIIERMHHLLRAFDWNLAEPWWGSWQVHEVNESGMRRCLFSGPKSFEAEWLKNEIPHGDAVYANGYLRVQALILDHKIPVLGFRLEERPGFGLNMEALAGLGLTPGAWIDSMRLALRDGRAQAEIDLPRPVAGLGERPRAGDLYQRIGAPQQPASLVYLTDFGATEENWRVLEKLPQRPTLLVCECAFLREEKEQARRSMHLCTEDFNRLLDLLRPRYAAPMHLSKAFLGRSDELYQEIEVPAGTRILRLPDYRGARPLLADEIAWQPDGGEHGTVD